MKKIFLLAVVLSLANCAPNIINTWDIAKYEVVNQNGLKSSSQNIGTITFKKGGDGVKNIKFDVFSNTVIDKSPFTYNLDEGYITIKSVGKEDKSPINKTWIIVENKSKSQVLKSTDGNNTVQIIELSR